MKVDTSNCQTVDEKIGAIESEYETVGNFFSCDVHPNVVRADSIRAKRLLRKRLELLRSPEYMFYQE